MATEKEREKYAKRKKKQRVEDCYNSGGIFCDAYVLIPEKANVHCLFAGDLLNFGSDTEAYEKEKHFIINIGKMLFETTTNASGVLWAYGYTNGPRGLKETLSQMKHSFEEFEENVNEKMKYEDMEKPKLTNPAAISSLNTASNRDENANCMIFFTGLKKIGNLKKLNPQKSSNFKRIVAVSLRGIDLSKFVVPPEGKAVKVTDKYSKDDVTKVIEAVLDADY